jgi:hypothetical protein
LKNNTREKLVLDNEGNAVKGSWNIIVGGVMCSFKKEIGIYQGYEMWSRLLCWDRKWIYVVSHFIKKGAVKPKRYVLSDGTWFGTGYRDVQNAKGDGDFDEKNILASAITKYVVKLGRLTVHPEVLLQASGLLPERPGGWHTMTGNSGESTPETLVSEYEIKTTETDKAPKDDLDTEWGWERVVAENERGLKLAEHFAALDGLTSEFSGSKTAALGRYKDFLW